MRNMLDCVSSY